MKDFGYSWLIKTKYLRGRLFMACERQEGSQFWRSLEDMKYEIRARVTYSIDDGAGTLF
jgi:hypothetical protein